jgi:UDPglucose--hexose-1-phosphate uridylyltransferase
MAEFRQNPITKEWVIIATERAKRPDQFMAKKDRKQPPAHDPNCVFCPGNEKLTPPEAHRIGGSGEGSDWQVRVVPNKFSALSPTGECVRNYDGLLKRKISGVGIHDVIIETPQHDMTTGLLSPEHVESIIRCYKDRYFAVTTDPRVELVTIFKNHGEAAGTSLEHPHSQLIATPITSPQVRRRLEDALRWYDEFGECLFCQTLRSELADGARVVVETPHFVSVVPYAALSPFHMWIFPRRHMASFGEIQPEEMKDLARNLQETLARLYHGVNNPDFNYTIRTAPSESRYVKYYHWYISIIPRLTRMAGFEIGTGFFINPTIPEENAAYLRAVKLPVAAAA